MQLTHESSIHHSAAQAHSHPYLVAPTRDYCLASCVDCCPQNCCTRPLLISLCVHRSCNSDRAFLGEPRVMVRSFISGGIMAILFIFLFSFVGIFGAMEAVLNPDR